MIPVLDLKAQYLELKDEIDAAIMRVVESGAFVNGPDVAAFEQEFAAYLGVKHSIGVANGTDALELALEAVGVGPGDRVITVPFTFAATVEAIVRVGATPVFVDIRDADFTIDVDQVEKEIARNAVKAVIPVHLYGHAAEMGKLMDLARRHDVKVIEDAAQAHGSTCTIAGKRVRVGSIGDVACFSFYPTKNLGGMGDGGACTSQHDDVARRLRLIANHGDVGKYEHAIPNGRNSRLDTLQAAVLRLKLPKLDRWNGARRDIAQIYTEGLKASPLRLPNTGNGYEHVFHQYAVRVSNRASFQESLRSNGVGSAVHYPRCLHRQAGWASLGYTEGAFPVSERCANEVVSLPMSPHLSPASAADVITAVQRALKG